MPPNGPGHLQPEKERFLAAATGTAIIGRVIRAWADVREVREHLLRPAMPRLLP